MRENSLHPKILDLQYAKYIQPDFLVKSFFVYVISTTGIWHSRLKQNINEKRDYRALMFCFWWLWCMVRLCMDDCLFEEP